MKCPKCYSVIADDAMECDCGWQRSSAKLKNPFRPCCMCSEHAVARYKGNWYCARDFYRYMDREHRTDTDAMLQELLEAHRVLGYYRREDEPYYEYVERMKRLAAAIKRKKITVAQFLERARQKRASA